MCLCPLRQLLCCSKKLHHVWLAGPGCNCYISLNAARTSKMMVPTKTQNASAPNELHPHAGEEFTL